MKFWVSRSNPQKLGSYQNTRLLELELHNSLSNSSLFIYKNNDLTMFILIYVNDIIITCSKNAPIDAFLQSLQSDFVVKALSNLIFFLAIEVIANSHKEILSQQRYILDTLKLTNMVESKACQLPKVLIHKPQLTMVNLSQTIPCSEAQQGI